MLTETLMWSPHSRQSRACSRPAARTQCVTRLIRPAFSAMGTKRSGKISPSRGCCQRTRPSTASTRPVARFSLGWQCSNWSCLKARRSSPASPATSRPPASAWAGCSCTRGVPPRRSCSARPRLRPDRRRAAAPHWSASPSARSSSAWAATCLPLAASAVTASSRAQVSSIRYSRCWKTRAASLSRGIAESRSPLVRSIRPAEARR